MPWSPSISVMRLIVEAVLTKAGSYESSPKSSGPVRNWRRSKARMAPLTMGRSEVLPVRLSVIVIELVAMVALLPDSREGSLEPDADQLEQLRGREWLGEEGRGAGGSGRSPGCRGRERGDHDDGHGRMDGLGGSDDVEAIAVREPEVGDHEAGGFDDEPQSLRPRASRHHPRGDAAQEELGEPRAAVRADDDEVCLLRLRGPDDLLVGYALVQQHARLDSGSACLVPQGGEPFLRVFARGGLEVLVDARGDVALSGHGNGQSHHVDEQELGAIGLGHGDGAGKRGVRGPGEVARVEDAAESAHGRWSPLTAGNSVTGPDLLGGHRPALADSVPHEEPAVAIHAGDAAHEGPAGVADLDLAPRQDIALSPRLEDGSRPALPVAPHPRVEGIEIVGGENVAVDLVTRGCPQRGRSRFRTQGNGEVVEADVQVGAHPDDDVLDIRVSRRALDAGASHLASVDEHVVGPLDGGRGARQLHGVGEGQPRHEREDRHLIESEPLAQENRSIEVHAWRREPRLSETPAPSRLRFRQNHRSLGHARAGEPAERGVRRLHLLEEEKLAAGQADAESGADAGDRERPGGGDHDALPAFDGWDVSRSRECFRPGGISMGAPVARTTQTGTAVPRSTDSVTLPMMMRPRPLLPCVLLTTRSAFLSWAARTMAGAAGPYHTAVSTWVIPRRCSRSATLER